MAEANIDTLVDDLRRVVDDAEALIYATSGTATEQAQAARARAEDTVRAARERLGSLQEEVSRRARDAARDADGYVRDNPWQAIAVAAGVAFVVGVIVGRR